MSISSWEKKGFIYVWEYKRNLESGFHIDYDLAGYTSLIHLLELLVVSYEGEYRTVKLDSPPKRILDQNRGSAYDGPKRAYSKLRIEHSSLEGDEFSSEKEVLSIKVSTKTLKEIKAAVVENDDGKKENSFWVGNVKFNLWR